MAKNTKIVKKPEQAEVIKDNNYTKKEIVWAFPSKSRCPRCGRVDTKAYSVGGVNGNIQYRRCLNPVCRHTYKEIGKAV